MFQKRAGYHRIRSSSRNVAGHKACIAKRINKLANTDIGNFGDSHHNSQITDASIGIPILAQVIWELW